MAFWRKSRPADEAPDKENAAKSDAAKANAAKPDAAEGAVPDEAAKADKSPATAASVMADSSQALEPISPAKRRRLQEMYNVGKRNFENGNYKYAADMFQPCFVADPANLEYAQVFLQNLHNLYENNKKGSSGAALMGMSAKSAMKKAIGKKELRSVIKSATDLLLLNPWDVTTLLAAADALQELGATDTHLFFLKAALQTNPKDPKLNKLAALSLAKLGDFAQAIVCWHRVEEAKPGDPEALKMISQLTIERTMPREKMVDTKPAAGKVSAPAGAASAGTGSGSGSGSSGSPKSQPQAAPELSEEQQLQAKINQNPTGKSGYLQLAEYYIHHNQLKHAERALEQGLAAVGAGDLELRGKLEDVQIVRVTRQLELAERQAAADPSEENLKLLKRIKAEQNRVELGIYASRCEMSPNNDSLRFELGVRLKRAGKFTEAIENLQRAIGEGKRKAATHLELGECFQWKKIASLAKTNYLAAIEHSRDRDPDVLKLALYRAGVLASHESDWTTAERHFTELAGLDYGFRDVADRLDKLYRNRHDK